MFFKTPLLSSLRPKTLLLLLALPMVLVYACKSPSAQETPPSSETETITFQNKGHELVYNMVQTLGTYEDLKALNGIVYTYTYRTPSGQEDVSTEKYLFDGELSLGHYTKHERTMPDLEGSITQSYDGSQVWVKHGDTVLNDPKAINSATFTRGTNFFWLLMMQKLVDPGINYAHLGTKDVNGIVYDLVDVTYDMPDGKASDTYRLYINPSTHLVDQFLFTVVDKGVVDTPLLMRVEYEDFEGVQLPSYRKYTRSNWEGDVLKEAWAEEICTDLKADASLSAADFALTEGSPD